MMAGPVQPTFQHADYRHRQVVVVQVAIDFQRRVSHISANGEHQADNNSDSYTCQSGVSSYKWSSTLTHIAIS